MKIVYIDNGVEQTLDSGLDFRTAAGKIRDYAPEKLGAGYDSQGNGFVSRDGTKKLELQED